MIEEQAMVIEVTDNTVTVQTQRQSACQSCGASKGCGTSVLSKVVGQKYAILTLDKSREQQPELHTGDQVLIGLHEDRLLAGSFFAYLLPLLSMLVPALIATEVGSYWVLTGEIHIILASVAGLVVGLLLARHVLQSSRHKAAYQPVLVRKLQQNQAVRDTILLP